MRILLLNTTPTRQTFSLFGMEGSYSGSGWVEEVVNYLSCGNEIFFACFWPVKEYMEKKNQNITYGIIPSASADLKEINEKLCNCIKKIYTSFEPDIVQIFGTEYRWTTEALKIINPQRVVIHITGLVGRCAEHYYGGLPESTVRNTTLRDMLKGGMRAGKRSFETAGRYEKESLMLAKNVIGRTDWDRACVTQINDKITYYHCDEMLRGAFYEHQWQPDKCEKHRIFVSAGNYPLKGIHKLIEAMALIKKKYPQARLAVAGNDITKYETLKDKISITSYGKYIKKLIRGNGLEEAVTFVGQQDTDGMLKQYLQAHIFVLPSAIENSSNSLSEAMMLGMPCVASCVGGTQNLLRDREEGYIYPFEESYMLAYYIMHLFENDDEAVKMGMKAREHALETHNREKICRRLTEIYQDILYNIRERDE
jgi:glycosyltransferase involved in cell wall biosynthesis